MAVAMKGVRVGVIESMMTLRISWSWRTQREYTGLGVGLFAVVRVGGG